MRCNFQKMAGIRWPDPDKDRAQADVEIHKLMYNTGYILYPV